MKKLLKDRRLHMSSRSPTKPAGTERCTVLFKEACCTLCFALCTFFPLIFSLGMTGFAIKQARSHLLLLFACYLSFFAHPDPETLKLLFCFVLDHLICSRESVSDRGETGQFPVQICSCCCNYSLHDNSYSDSNPYYMTTLFSLFIC